ncbi:DUF397 domain-containing protein [Actinomadura harenae]|uniref:DUF397 domain-containing protein n=1 Tax=Actinomadura harenae TaxID=2483351 RepID=A0A3M2M4Z7_9ACTN|nr:DUF397 domain-containing protein [Actinomadura harenae]RMI42198.1 DUF397 domain-containing protein [Actinomadura harenae]
MKHGSLTWKKSSHSGEQYNCVEMARLTGTALAVRDSKAPNDPFLVLDRGAWFSLRAALSGGGTA